MEKTRPLLQRTSNTLIFSEPNMAKLHDIMYEHKVPAGSYLFLEGDSARNLYYIRQGRVKLTKSTSEGKEFVLYRFQEGDILGQFDPCGNSKQGFNAKAIEDCVLGVIQKSDLEVLLWQHGDLALEFMKWMGLMHRMTQTKFQDLMLYGKQGALCSTLIRLTNSYGKPHEGGILISEKMTHTELADYIGAARESVNRMLSDLKQADVIRCDDGYIIVRDLEYLRTICHCEMCPKEICRM